MLLSLQIPVVLVFQELLQNQEKFPRHYSHGLDGCGKDLEERVRDSFHDFVRYLVRVVDVSSKTGLHRFLIYYFAICKLK